MHTIMDLCFLCAKDYNCVSVDDKIVTQVEYLLPEITIIQLGIPLRICTVCDGALYAFSKFKQFYIETSQCLEARIKGAQTTKKNEAQPSGTPDHPLHTDNILVAKPENVEEIHDTMNTRIMEEIYIKKEQTSLDNEMHTDSSLLYPVVLLQGDDAVPSQHELHMDFDNTEQIFIKEEQLDETSQDQNLYNIVQDTLKQECSINNSSNVCKKSQPEQNTVDETMTSHIRPEMRMECSADLKNESLKYNVKHITNNTKNLTNLKKKIQQNEKLRCNVCNAYFLCKTDLVRHMKKIHLRINHLSCGFCKKIFIYKYDLSRHMQLHNGIKNFQCSICKKRFLNENNLKHHLTLHTVQKQYSCKICNEIFTSESNLKSHIMTHERVKVNEEVICTLCKKLFKYESDSDQPIGVSIKDFTCDNCNPKTRNFCVIQDIKTRCGVKDYECTTCNKTFTKKYRLDRHIKTHSDIRDYKCDICNKMFTQRSHLNTHIKIHYGIKDFECEVCQKSFTDRSTFSKHIKIHSKIKDYQCDICVRSFTQKGALVRHMKMHTGVLQFH